MTKLTQELIKGLSSNGKLAKFTSVGCYTLLYTTRNGDYLCADCATESHIYDEFGGLSEDPALYVSTYDEGPVLHCENCGESIEASYGDPESDVDGLADAKAGAA